MSEITWSCLHDRSLPQALVVASCVCSNSCFSAERSGQCLPWTPRIERTWPRPHTWWRIWVWERSAHSTALCLPQRYASPQTAAQTRRPQRPPAVTCNVLSVWGTSVPVGVGWWSRCQTAPRTTQCQTPPTTGSAGFQGCSWCGGPA